MRPTRRSKLVRRGRLLGCRSGARLALASANPVSSPTQVEAEAQGVPSQSRLFTAGEPGCDAGEISAASRRRAYRLPMRGKPSMGRSLLLSHGWLAVAARRQDRRSNEV